MVWIVHVHPPLHSPHGNHVVLDHARTVGINRSVDEYCRESATGAYVWLDHDDLALLVSCRPATEGTLEVGSKELAKRLVEHIQSQTGIAVTVAIGGVRESLYEAHSSYSEATEALAYQNFADISGIISGQDVRTRHGSSNEWVEFNQLTEQLKAELKLGHSSRAEAILQKLFEILSAKEGMNFLERQLLLNQLVYSVIICMGEINPSLRDVYDGNPYADFREMHTIGEIHHWLHQTVRQTVTYVMTRKENKQVERIEHVYRYVQEHYMDDVTLQTMADKLYMNPQYFSKWFRDLTGKPYVEYVTEIRLEAALKMLETHNAKVYEIAEKTGFGNRINFIRAFKKHYGKTPSDYRAGMFLSDHEPEKDGT
jgi:YesN/AraC family two-component response regulator